MDVISFGGGFNLPLWIAQARGLFEIHDVRVRLHTTADSRQVFQGLMDGHWNVAITAFDNIVAYQEAQAETGFGKPTDFFAFMGSDEGFLSLVGAAHVRSVRDLRGRSVSVDAMTNGFAFVVREILARAGVQETEVRWVRAGGTDRRFAALVAGEHDATLLRTPFDLLAADRGLGHLASVRSTLGPYLGIVGAARRSWAEGHVAELIGFIRGYRDAVLLLQDVAHRHEAVAMLLAHSPGMEADLAVRCCDRLCDPRHGFFADLRLDLAGARTVLALRSRLAQPPRDLQHPEQYMDDAYLRRALARAGA